MKDKEILKLKEEIKEELRTELKEEIMIELLRKIFYNNTKENQIDNKEFEKLKQENDELKNQLQETLRKKQELENTKNEEIQNLKTKNLELENSLNKLENENNSLLTKIKELEKQQIKELKEFEKLYSQLSETTKSSLKNVLKNDNQLSLFCSGIYFINDIWDYALHLETEHNDKEFEIVKNMFYLLFETYKNIENVTLDETKENDEFNSDLHLRNNRSEEYSGPIKKVILKGYKKKNKIIKQSLVEL